MTMSSILGKTVAVMGLGYVGLPLALAFGRVMTTIGFDVNESKLQSYRNGYDPTGEISPDLFQKSTELTFTSNPVDLKHADFIVVAVPTPIDNAKQPNLTPVIEATRILASHLRNEAIVIYESTVYPGVTEEVCAPIIESLSGGKRGTRFKLGYSPERIVSGDKMHRLENIIKLVAAEDADTLDKVAKLYEAIIEAGVYRVSSIRIAEAAKVIENTQRDVNIALMNELAIIFNLMGIDTLEVLEAAGTKWNFLPFRPGLVGGHCIGIDPYYLTHKVKTLGYNPEIILAGRRINDKMGAYIAQQTIKQMMLTGSIKQRAVVLILGLTFKENCADIRNTKVVDIIEELREYGCVAQVWDPIASKHEAQYEYNITLLESIDEIMVDAVIAAVAHEQVKSLDLSRITLNPSCLVPFMDIKSVFSKQVLMDLGYLAWRL